MTQSIAWENTFLGIEFGSTRIKAVLTDETHTPIASGSYRWENRYENGIWTYSDEEIRHGLQGCYQDLSENLWQQYGRRLCSCQAIGISAMMHGYLAFDNSGQLLTPFRTWRNTITKQASEELTSLLNFHIPQRWSIAHLYEDILHDAPYLKQIAYLTTLAGYLHWLLSGEKVLGVGDASGMFPIDATTNSYDSNMVKIFENAASQRGFSQKLSHLLPKVLTAGQPAGVLTKQGALLLDPSGMLEAGIPMCPPEGDAGTGMVATNSVAKRTGNVSAGTSIFAMIVLEKQLERVYPEIDLVTTPAGDPVAMVHCNNCTCEIDAWTDLFSEVLELTGHPMETDQLLTALNRKSLEGDADCGGMIAFNYLSGEHITGMQEGRPLFVRRPDSKFTLANFMRLQLYTSMATLKLGLELLRQEHVQIERMFAHGGLLKTPEATQRYLAAAMESPVSVLTTAGEGGAWGMALLAAYMVCKQPKETLASFLESKVFLGKPVHTCSPIATDIEGFATFLKQYQRALAIEQTAIDAV